VSAHLHLEAIEKVLRVFRTYSSIVKDGREEQIVAVDI
jgi:hypothetical protein